MHAGLQHEFTTIQQRLFVPLQSEGVGIRFAERSWGFYPCSFPSVDQIEKRRP